MREGDKGTGRGVGLARATPYNFTPSETEADVDSLQKNLAYSDPISKDAGSVHRLETPEPSIHQVPVISWTGWTDFPVADLDSLASLNGDGGKYG